LGLLDHDALFRLYADADLLLNLRLTQAVNTPYLFPSKLLEYFAIGKPVLSTAVAHTEKEYGALCYILRDETAAGVAEAIRRIRAVPAGERRELGCRARAFMLAHRTWDAQGARIRAYLERQVFGDAPDPAAPA
jgi:glycosyltransferase involved in cell wall biosynthesis